MRSKKVQKLIDDMNVRSKKWKFSWTEEGNAWLHFFLEEIGEYRGYREHEEDGKTWCETL